MLVINGINVPSPTTYGVSIEQIHGSDSGRNCVGDMLLDYITSKYKVELEWKNISRDAANKIYSALNSQTFSATFINANGQSVTAQFYAGTQSAQMYSYNNGNPIWGSYKVNIVQI